MIELGVINKLIAVRQTDNGIYLEDEEQNEVLLPNAYINGVELKSTIDVFVYTDSEDRPVACTLTSKIAKNEVAKLHVKSVTFLGAFMDWGFPKDLLAPFDEQVFPMEEGKSYWVVLKEDQKTKRLFASSKLKKHLNNDGANYAPGDEVSLVVLGFTDLGMDVLINNKHIGLVYNDDIYIDLNYGDELKGYIKRIREDNKIDVSIRKFGYNKVKDSTDVILEKLIQNAGTLSLSDKSSPEDIEKLLNMSKKNFKKTIGLLYKEGKISIYVDKITLTNK